MSSVTPQSSRKSKMTGKINRPVKLLELRATYTTGGGPDKTILLSAEKHDKSIVTPVVAYLKDISDDDFQIGRMAEGRGFEYIEVLDRGKIDIKCIIELNGIVRKHNIDIIHGHDYKTDILAYILSLLNPKVRLVSTAHGWITNTLKGSLYKWIHLRVLRRFENLIAVSGATKLLMSASGIKSDAIKVIYNGIDESKWSNDEQIKSLKAEWDLSENALVIGTVGRISDEKDYITFMEIAKTVTDKIENVYFVIVGEGKQDEREKLAAYADSLEITDKVVFAGYRSDLLNVYKTFDVFLMTSITEGLPNTMLEAMSMGIPVAAFQIPGVDKLIIHDNTGLMADFGDVEGLKKCLERLLFDETFSRQIAENGRKYILENFSASRMAEEYIGLFQEICKDV